MANNKLHFLMNNTEFAKKIRRFRDACSKANVQPTKRQASKWRNKKGIAYKTVNPSV